VSDLFDRLRTETADWHWQAVKTHCLRGHPLSGENLYVDPKYGHRKCRECRRRWQRIYNRGRG